MRWALEGRDAHESSLKAELPNEDQDCLKTEHPNLIGVRLLTIHNLYRYMEFMRELRQALEQGTMAEMRRALMIDE